MFEYVRQLRIPQVNTLRLKLVITFVVCFRLVSLCHAQETTVFQDKTAELGIQLPNGNSCWTDFNNDGWVDLCAAGSVWINDSGKKFTKLADVGMSVAADFDNDGFVDVFSWASIKLFRNQGGQKFTEFPLPELPKTVSRGACWGDFNGDGFVDLFIGGYEDWNAGITWPFLLLLNEKGKSFRVARSESKLRARGVTACDFDQDGDLDVYVSNYRLQPNLLWQNDGKGQLNEVAAAFGVVATKPGFGGGHSVGATWGDFNNDGFIDLFAGNFAHVDRRGDQPKSRFLQNLGEAGKFKFKDLGPSGVHYQESYATPSAADYDNDGNLDIFFTTVYGTASFGRRNNPVLFRNEGNFKVTDVTAQAKLNGLPPTYQAAWADFDNDGDLDLLSGGKLFANQHKGNGWLKVQLEGDGKTTNRSAIGAQVRVKVGDKTYTRQVEAGTGEGNQNELTLHFGLGKHKGSVDIEILWPNKQRVQHKAVPINQLAKFKFVDAP